MVFYFQRVAWKYSFLKLNSQLNYYWLLATVNNYPRVNFYVGWGVPSTVYVTVWDGTLWSCYSDIIYITSPDNCWLYLFLKCCCLFLFASYPLVYMPMQTMSHDCNCHSAVCQWWEEKGDSLDIPPIIPLENWYRPPQ